LNEKNGKLHIAYEISSSNHKIFLAVETQKLGHLLSKEFDVIFVSGARLSTIKPRITFLGFAKFFIIENGGLILDRKLSVNQEWYNYLEFERKSLNEIGQLLKKQGWILDEQGRTSAIRIMPSDNPHKTQDEINYLYNELELPDTLKKTYNMRNLDIILRSAGKDNAVNFLLKKNGYDIRQSISIGDDINDLELLNIASRSYVLANSSPAVIKMAEKKRWHVSSEFYFDGINEILKKIQTTMFHSNI
jgi:hydroxymethylpyrimidine pyrophosphatase-like HAD family hydrolase